MSSRGTLPLRGSGTLTDFWFEPTINLLGSGPLASSTQCGTYYTDVYLDPVLLYGGTDRVSLRYLTHLSDEGR